MSTEAGRLKPKFQWIESIVGIYSAGVLPAGCVLIFTISSSCIFAFFQWGGYYVFTPTWWAVLLLGILFIISILSKYFKICTVH